MNKIYLLGDIHGSYKPIESLYCYLAYDKLMPPDESDLIILLGDFGGNYFFNNRDDHFKEKLGKYPFNYFVIRGNHEERPFNCAKEYPELWTKGYDDYLCNTVWIEKKYPYIKYAVDYPLDYKLHDHSTIVFPGAYSVDKYYRLANNWSWFKDEQLTKEEMDFGRNITDCFNKYEIVLSHTCPICYEPTDLFLSSVDQNMVDKTMERYLGEMERKIDYQLWCWGHYHQTRVYPNPDGKDRVMLFNDSALDLDKYFETKNPYDALIKFAAV